MCVCVCEREREREREREEREEKKIGQKGTGKCVFKNPRETTTVQKKVTAKLIIRFHEKPRR